MSFLSIEFFLLFFVTVLLFFRTKSHSRKNFILLLASYFFYACWDIRFLLLLIGLTWVNWFLAKKMKTGDYSRQLCILGVSVSLIVLGVFKYFNFFLDTAYQIFYITEINTINIILPVGISFYTFQAMSYLIDVYRGELEAREDFLTVALYISFFPQLVAGPIVRASHLLPQLDKEHFIEKENVEAGVQIFLIGVVKKIVIADRLAVCADAVFATPVAYDGASVLCAVFAYAMQIYCDFSGYSDMAVGIARFWGYDLCRNFNLPYLAQNPTEFWKRWHISLSSWLQDYVYIPFGGNRKGKIRTYVNLMLTMLLGGLWHGASWHFVMWGGMHGGALVIHKLWLLMRERNKKSNSKKQGISIIGILLTFSFVSICWVFFRAESVETAIVILQRLFAWETGIHYIYIYTVIYGILLLVVHIWALVCNHREGRYVIFNLDNFGSKIVICLILWGIVIFAYAGETAFIYFQF